jgi:hypothetical protein
MEDLKIIECHRAHRGDVEPGQSTSNESNITVIFVISITVYFTREIQTLPGLRNSYIPESLEQGEFCARLNSINT